MMLYMPRADGESRYGHQAAGRQVRRCMHSMHGMHGMGGMHGMYLMYASGKALVALAISARTWLASLQPNMGSLYMAQYLRQTQ